MLNTGLGFVFNLLGQNFVSVHIIPYAFSCGRLAVHVSHLDDVTRIYLKIADRLGFPFLKSILSL